MDAWSYRSVSAVSDSPDLVPGNLCSRLHQFFSLETVDSDIYPDRSLLDSDASPPPVFVHTVYSVESEERMDRRALS